ncbi:MAG: homogentisate 1,2-dioxygenase [Acidimicrobiia bacterium]|nr:homogentisate 1,2-dioxygenase [Acidimicrobiia bacterium]
MPYYRQVGEIPAKRHTQFRQPDGSLYAEELMGEEGFSFDSSLLYHIHPPTALKKIEGVESDPQTTTPNHPLKPRHFKTHQLKAGGDMVKARAVLLANEDCAISYYVGSDDSPLYKNAIGDEMVFIERGTGTLETVFGAIRFQPHDCLIIPASVIHQYIIDESSEPVRALILETRGHIGPPRRYLSRNGQFLEHSPYCERDQHAPTAPLLRDDTEVDVLVKHRGGLTRFVYEHHPFDVVGWDGCLYPYRFSVDDFEPITGRVHQPPPVHQMFEAPNLVVCAFVPRLFDYHPEAIPAPYNHSNVDSDEVLFYVEGDFMSRKGAGIEQGSISLHPGGHTHGPQPGSVEASIGKKGTEELAIMIDTFRALDLGPGATDSEEDSYAWTWLEGR